MSRLYRLVLLSICSGNLADLNTATRSFRCMQTPKRSCPTKRCMHMSYMHENMNRIWTEYEQPTTYLNALIVCIISSSRSSHRFFSSMSKSRAHTAGRRSLMQEGIRKETAPNEKSNERGNTWSDTNRRQRMDMRHRGKRQHSAWPLDESRNNDVWIQEPECAIERVTSTEDRQWTCTGEFEE